MNAFNLIITNWIIFLKLNMFEHRESSQEFCIGLKRDILYSFGELREKFPFIQLYQTCIIINTPFQVQSRKSA